MVDIGTAHGLRTTAVLTDMSVPLGRAVGNALEVAESVEVLRGGGPPDVVALTVALAREMLGAGRDRRRPRGGARVGRGVPGVGGDDRRAGRRPVGAAAGGDARRGAAGGALRRARALRRAGGRSRGLAARRRPGAQGARGAGGGGGPSAGRYRATRWRPVSPCWNCTRTRPTPCRARSPRWTAESWWPTARLRGVPRSSATPCAPDGRRKSDERHSRRIGSDESAARPLWIEARSLVGVVAHELGVRRRRAVR